MANRDDLVKVGRLAMRREGEFWNAYWAKSETMDGAILLGSIRMSLVEQNEARKAAFLECMRECTKDAIEATFGHRPDMKTGPAPEHERSGRA